MPRAPITHRGWEISYDPPPIPWRGADWTATHPDYDGIGDPRIVTAGTLEMLKDAIDGFIYEENAP